VIKPAAGYRGPLAYSSPEAVQTTGTVADLPKYASNSRTQGTPEEYKATVQGYLGYFGTYALNGSDLVFHIEGSSFPNWNGAEQKRTNVTITGDELKYSQPTPSAGGSPVVIVWKRAH
jgi:hypothetical protein